MPGFPAEAIGLLPGDTIKQINEQPIPSSAVMAAEISRHPGQPIQLVVERKGRQFPITITPTDQGKIGFVPRVERGAVPLPVALEGAAFFTYQGLVMPVKFLLATVGILPTQPGFSVDDVRGPAGILQILYEGIQRSWYDYGFVVAWISLSVAFFNILPIPGLDGWHVLLLGIEKIRGRQLSYSTMKWLSRWGFALLISITLYASFNDIRRWLW